MEKKKFLAWRFRAKPCGETLDVPYLVKNTSAMPRTILMDKGYDSNPLHTWLREEALIWSVAPVRKGCRRGRYRKEMRDYFDYGLYWQRNVVECLFGAVKRLFGVTCPRPQSQYATNRDRRQTNRLQHRHKKHNDFLQSP